MLKLMSIINGISITFIETNEFDVAHEIFPECVDQARPYALTLLDERQCRDHDACVLQ